MASKLKIKPPDWTQVPNVFFDSLLPGLTGAECKVCCIVIRETFGWHFKTTNKHLLSLSYLAKATGLGRRVVSTVLASLLQENNERSAILGRKKRKQNSYSYYLLVDTGEESGSTSAENALSKNRPTSAENAPVLVQKVHRPHVLERNMKERVPPMSSVPTENLESAKRDDGKKNLDARVKKGASVIKWFEEVSNGNTWGWVRDGKAFDEIKHLPDWAILFGMCQSIQKCPEHRFGGFAYCVGAIREAAESSMRDMDPDLAMRIAQAERRKARACIKLGKFQVSEMTEKEFDSVMRESRAGD